MWLGMRTGKRRGFPASRFSFSATTTPLCMLLLPPTCLSRGPASVRKHRAPCNNPHTRGLTSGERQEQTVGKQEVAKGVKTIKGSAPAAPRAPNLYDSPPTACRAMRRNAVPPRRARFLGGCRSAASGGKFRQNRPEVGPCQPHSVNSGLAESGPTPVESSPNLVDSVAEFGRNLAPESAHG